MLSKNFVLMLMPFFLYAGTLYPAIESTTGAPAQHVYKSIDFGLSNINNQRIQIRSDAPSGSPVYTSQLDVNNAGIQAGYIAPNSHLIYSGTNCSSTQLGMIVQQTGSTAVAFLTSQLQCMYNPTFCSDTGYCYLPIKTSRFVYQYSSLHTSGQCPSGTIIDNNQPSAGISPAINCPLQPGWSIVQTVHGVGINCYTGVTNMTFCTGYQTVCSYIDQTGNSQQIIVAALAQIRCTNISTTYIVNNYTP